MLSQKQQYKLFPQTNKTLTTKMNVGTDPSIFILFSKIDGVTFDWTQEIQLIKCVEDTIAASALVIKKSEVSGFLDDRSKLNSHFGSHSNSTIDLIKVRLDKIHDALTDNARYLTFFNRTPRFRIRHHSESAPEFLGSLNKKDLNIMSRIRGIEENIKIDTQINQTRREYLNTRANVEINYPEFHGILQEPRFTDIGADSRELEKLGLKAKLDPDRSDLEYPSRDYDPAGLRVYDWIKDQDKWKNDRDTFHEIYKGININIDWSLFPPGTPREEFIKLIYREVAEVVIAELQFDLNLDTPLTPKESEDMELWLEDEKEAAAAPLHTLNNPKILGEFIASFLDSITP